MLKDDRLEDLRAKLRNSRATAHQLEALRELVEAEVIALKADLAAAPSRLAAILADNDAATATITKNLAEEDALQASIVRRIAVADELRVRVEARFAARRAAEEDARQQSDYAATAALCSALEAEWPGEVQKAIALVNELHTKFAEAELARERVNRKLPIGAAPIHRIDHVRYPAPRPAAVAVKSKVTLWVNLRTGQPATAAEARCIDPQGVKRLPAYEWRKEDQPEFERRECERTEWFAYRGHRDPSASTLWLLGKALPHLQEINWRPSVELTLEAAPFRTEDRPVPLKAGDADLPVKAEQAEAHGLRRAPLTTEATLSER
jgi:hypothetical protein